MGTITIEEFQYVGGKGQMDQPVPYLKGMKRTSDASTSSSVENVVLQDDTSFVRVVGDADHRIAITDSAVSTDYATVGTTALEYGVDGGDTLYYRTDA